MKLFAAFALVSAVMAQYDDLGNKKNQVDKVCWERWDSIDSSNAIQGPRECKGIKIADTATSRYKCKSRQSEQKNRHLSKRCKVQCGKSKNFTGNKKVYCDPKVGWVLRKGNTPVTIGTCN